MSSCDSSSIETDTSDSLAGPRSWQLNQERAEILLSGATSLAGSPGGSDGKASACSAGDPGSISGLGRSPGKGNGNPLQYSCLENSTDWGAWLQSMGSQRVGHNTASSLWLFEILRMWYHTVFVFFWLISLIIMPSRFLPVVTNGRISFFLRSEYYI